MVLTKEIIERGGGSQSTILTISMPREMLATIDEAVRKLNTDRSKAVRFAIEQVYGQKKEE